MDTCTTPQSLAMSAHSSVTGTPQAIRAWLMSSRRDSPVNPSVPQADDLERTTTATCGPKQRSAFASYDRDTACWRTFQDSFLLGASEPFSETWPRAGTMLDGVCYRQRKWEHRIDAIGSLLWPTPRATDHKGGHGKTGNRTEMASRMAGWTLPEAVKTWATPQARDWKSGKSSAETYAGNSRPLSEQVGLAEDGGQLNPQWVEWLMGWPVGWTELKPLATGKFQQWLQQFGGF